MKLGIDAGSGRLKGIVISENNIRQVWQIKHQGDISSALEKLFNNFSDYPVSYIGISGEITGLEQYSSSAAYSPAAVLMKAVEGFIPKCGSVLDVGAQHALFINNIASEEGPQIYNSSGCSAGTGSFFEEQLNRIGVSSDDLDFSPGSEERIPRIAARCTVFARTDIIHRQQEGYSPSEIIHGLIYAVAAGVSSNLLKKGPVKLPLCVVGGLAENPIFIHALGKINGIDPKDFIIPPSAAFMTAAGAALLAPVQMSLPELQQHFREGVLSAGQSEPNKGPAESLDDKKLSPLSGYGKDDSAGKQEGLSKLEEGSIPSIGIDVGSTSTNLVLLNEENEIVDYIYILTKGRPFEAVKEGFISLQQKHGFKRFKACVTGSGRRRCSEYFGIPLAKDEITAQSRGGLHSYPQAEIIFEIGGQDSKFISLNDGEAADFKMNRICAAGTGAFLQEQADKLDLSIEKFASMALEASKPLELDANCTVFMETTVSRAIQAGADQADAAAGLCYGVVKNYLDRVAGDWQECRTILLQGGIAFNQAVVNAFRYITGKEIIVPPWFSVTGALGAALYATESSEILSSIKDGGAEAEAHSAVMKASSGKKQPPPSPYLQELLKSYKKPGEPGREKRVGIPRSLFLYKLFPLFNGFFSALGLEVIFSDNSDEKIIDLAQQYCSGEVCYPIKLLYGHCASLLEQKVDYLFLPALLTLRHEGSEVRRNCACMFMQTSPYMIENTFRLKERGTTLLAPGLNMELGKQELAGTLKRLGKELGFPLPRIAAAAASGIKNFALFQKALMKQGQAFVQQDRPDKPVFVLVTRAYGIQDPELNKGIPSILKDLGVSFTGLSSLPLDSYNIDTHQNMYWPFGQHILAGAEFIRNQDNVYMVYLTNHGCGPDSILLNYIEGVMGSKHWLHIEIDEHASAEGIRTRLEAFLHTIESKGQHQNTKQSEIPDDSLYQRPASSGAEQEQWLNPSFIPLPLGKEILENIPYDTACQHDGYRTSSKEDPAVKVLISHSLAFAETSGGRGSLLIPANIGGGTDGQYGRLIKEVLCREGFNDMKIYTPFVEDLILMEPSMFRPFAEAVVKSDLETIDKQPEQPKQPEQLKRHSSENENPPEMAEEKKNVLITADPWIMGDRDWLSEDIFSPLYENNIRPMPMFISEMLQFYWLERLFGSDSSHKKRRPSREEASLMEKTARDNLDYLKALLNNARNSRKGLTSLAPDGEELWKQSKDIFPGLCGGYVRYFAAKQRLEAKLYSGHIHVSGLYDNGASVLEAGSASQSCYYKYKSRGNPAGKEELDNFIFRINLAKG